MPPDPYVTTHIHTEGPIPGPHSLLTLTSAAVTADGVPTSTFSLNVRELPGAVLHPSALAEWRVRPEDWLVTRRAAVPPAAAVASYVRWVRSLPGAPVFVADTSRSDYLFVYWYLQRFAGVWPFAWTCQDPGTVARLPEPAVCPLPGCRSWYPGLARTS